jgi:hypothetical protein
VVFHEHTPCDEYAVVGTRNPLHAWRDRSTPPRTSDKVVASFSTGYTSPYIGEVATILRVGVLDVVIAAIHVGHM